MLIPVVGATGVKKVVNGFDGQFAQGAPTAVSAYGVAFRREQKKLLRKLDNGAERQLKDHAAQVMQQANVRRVTYMVVRTKGGKYKTASLLPVPNSVQVTGPVQLLAGVLVFGCHKEEHIVRAHDYCALRVIHAPSAQPLLKSSVQPAPTK